MRIKNHYIEGFNKISDKYGEVFCGYEIPEDISLEQAIGYTNEYIIKSKPNKHFRYDYYRKILAKAVSELDFNPANNRIIHLDLGCGPGLFSWVVQDYMLLGLEKNHSDLDLIGYDHAKNMIRLASLFQGHLRKHLPVEYNLGGYFKIVKIQNMLKSRDFSDCDILITFGHVLIQVKDDPEALQNFVGIIKNLFPSRSCILVAVDAYKHENRRRDFYTACTELQSAIVGVGVNVKDKRRGRAYSWMYARLSQEK